MHYGNGREAKNGDKVVHISPYNGNLSVGILYDAMPGNDYCNGKIATTYSSDICPNLKECIHLDDLKALLPAQEGVLTDSHSDFLKRIEKVPDTSKS